MSILAPQAVAEIIKWRDTADTFRIVIRGQEAEPLIASLGKHEFVSREEIDFILCGPSRDCVIRIKTKTLQSFEQTQEQLRLAELYGLPKPATWMPKAPSDQLLAARIADSGDAGRLYDLMPGPEDEMNLTLANGQPGKIKTKTFNLEHEDFYMNCQHVMTDREGYRCAITAIVPSGR